MADIGLGSLVRDGKLQMMRGVAIERYAHIEQSLFQLFASWLGTSNDKAGIVFFRIASAHARNKILEALLRKAHRSEFDVYWFGERHKKNGLFALIRQLDAIRNEIVHWHVASEIYVKGPPEQEAVTVVETLNPPNFWNKTENTPSMTIEQLRDFAEKADFVHRSLICFSP